MAKEGYDPVYGARPLKRYIQHEIINQLSNAILEGKIPAHAKIRLKIPEDKIGFEIK